MQSFNQKYNPNWNTDLVALAADLCAGNRTALAKAITLVESNKNSDFPKVQELLKLIQEQQKSSFRIGITGTPGVGKSTFIEALGLELIQRGHKIAVLAIDPTSAKSGGSILGDKTRMNQLSKNENVFIRPTPSGTDLGGVAAKTSEVIMLCEAAGFDRIIIETVGVGQSEYKVAEMSDIFILLTLPNSGDELQGIKRGIMEMADLIIVNKSDGNNLKNAKLSKKQIENAIHLMPQKESGIEVKTLLCSALYQTGIREAADEIEHFYKTISESGFLQENRKNQTARSLESLIKEKVWENLLQNLDFQKELNLHLQNIKSEGTSAYREIQTLLQKMEVLKSIKIP